MTYMEHPMFPWSQNQHLSYSESEIASRVLFLQHARKLISDNSDEAKAASKRAYDIKTKARRFAPGEDVLLHFPDPPKGISRKLYIPWRGIYTIIEKTNGLTYKLRKKGSRIKTTHINRSNITTRIILIQTKKMKKPKHNPRDLRPSAETAHYPRQLIDLPH